jgi:hypothetical protein
MTQPSAWTLKTDFAGTERAYATGGVLSIIGDATNAAYADQSFTTVSGTTYETTFTFTGGSPTVTAGTSQGGSQLASATPSLAGTYTFKFTATGTTTWLRIARTGATTAAVDNVSIKEVTAIGTYAKRSATFDEFFVYTAGSTAARTYIDNTGVRQTMDQAGYGAEAVTNGTFTTDEAGPTVTGWVTASSATASTSGGRLRVTNAGAASRYVSQSLTTVAGTTYSFSVTGYVGT